MKKFLILGAAVIGFLSACKKNDSTPVYTEAQWRAQYTIDSTKIQAFLKANNITDAQMDSSGVFYRITTPGTGTDVIKVTSYPTVAYQGYLMNGTSLGTKFDSSDSTNFGNKYQMGNLIPGWYYGLRNAKKGGTTRLYIPSGYGYGYQDNGPIPANSVLIFDVRLIDFTNGN